MSAKAKKPFIRKVSDGLIRVAELHVWQLVLLLVPLIFLSATFLRMNNLGMVERRAAVLAADKAGNPDTVQRALADLQSFVSGHMNTDMGKGVYLQASYNKAYDSALSSAADTNNPNSTVYQQAALTCRSRFVGGVQSFRDDYVQCVVDQVSQLAPQATATAALPKADDYRFDYVSPLWSPDFAGLFTLLTAIVGLLIIVKAITWLILRLLVRRYYRRD
jgi:hypothetical protein